MAIVTRGFGRGAIVAHGLGPGGGLAVVTKPLGVDVELGGAIIIEILDGTIDVNIPDSFFIDIEDN